MALIKCKECGREISDKATACIHCGCPVNSSQVPSEEQYKPSKKKRWLVVGLAGVAVVAVAAAFLYKSMFEGGTDGKRSLWGGDEVIEVIVTPEFAEAVRQYDQLEPFSDGMAAVGKNGKWGYINHKGEEVIPCQYDNYYEYGEGNEKSEMSFCASHPFCEGVAVVRLNEKWGIIDNKGNVIVEYGKYESIGDCHDGMLLAQNEGKRYMLNKNGEIAFDISGYEECKSFSEGLCEVKKDGKYGYIDTNGNIVIPCKYTTANAFKEGKAIVDYSEWGFTCIDRQGNVLYKKENLQVVWDGGYRDGMLAVYEKDGEYDIKYGFLNDKGEIAVPCFDGWKEGWSYDNFEQGLFYFSEGYTCIKKYNYDSDGNPVLVTTFISKQGNKKSFPYNPYGGETSEHRVFSEGMACVTDNNGKVGFMDLEGNLTIPFKYDVAPNEEYYCWSDKYGTFHEGVALVRMGDRWGYVDKNGNDTFTAADAETFEAKLREETEERRLQEERQREIERQQQEESEIKSWIEGNWRYSTQQYGMTMEMRVGISGDMIVVMMNGERHYAGPYTIEGNHIVYNRGGGSSDYIVIDKANHRLMVNDTTPMQRFSGSSSMNGGHSSSSDSRISRVEKKVQEDIEELNYMVQSGNMNPMNIQVLKQSLPSNLDQLISYYREQGNSTKYNECVYKKQVVMRIFREIGI